jgi:23S rRNA (guanosine2251-2'-O)-methyltransferase
MTPPGRGRGGGRSGSGGGRDDRSGSRAAGRGGSPRAASGRGGPKGTGRAAAGAGRPGVGRAGAGRVERGGRTGSDRDGQAPRRSQETPGLGGEQVEGRQAVRELLLANRRTVRTLMMVEGMDAAAILDDIEALATKRRVRVDYVSRKRLDGVARTDGAQGVVALAKPVEEVSLEQLCEPSRRGRLPFLVVMDGITDPHNLGALLRSAECAGVTGVVLPRHRAVHLSPTVAKVAAGAIEYLPMTLVPGIPNALQRLSALGVWTVGLAGDAPRPLYELPLGQEPLALVLGSEDKGLAALTRKRCDALGSIPQHGTLSSLNVATAGAIACFDVARGRADAGGE